MKRFQRTPLWQFLYSPLSLVGLLIVVIVLGKAAWSVYQKERIASERQEASLYELQKLEERHAVLEDTVAGLNNPEGMEEALRAKFPVARPQEQVIIISGNSRSLPVEPVAPAEQNLWMRIKGFLIQ
mgnify:CR=1 FL=1